MTKSILTLSLLTLLACGDEEKTEGMTPGDCTDGADNDGDGDFDCDDDGCAGSPDCSGTNDTGSEDTGGTGTSDGADNDGDGVSENDGDCDDSDATIYPGASDTTVDGVDQDCNNFDGPDGDGDGYGPESAGGTDCDDNNASINPDASEDFNDGLDNDCDGFTDVANVQCSADMTIEFPDGESVTLDFCQSWGLESTFEYDLDNPPELNSLSLNLNATSATDFDCSIQIEQEGICGEGYYRQGLSTGSTVMATMDCSGVSDGNEQTLNFSEGYLRIDSIETGNQSGSFAGQPLNTGLVGHLHVWNADGNDLEGDISISVEQLASDAGENVCSVLEGDDDGDGYLSEYFDGDDCDDSNPNLLGSSNDMDCDGVATIDDCDDADPYLFEIVDGECTGNPQITVSWESSYVRFSSIMSLDGFSVGIAETNSNSSAFWTGEDCYLGYVLEDGTNLSYCHPLSGNESLLYFGAYPFYIIEGETTVFTDSSFASATTLIFIEQTSQKCWVTGAMPSYYSQWHSWAGYSEPCQEF